MELTGPMVVKKKSNLQLVMGLSLFTDNVTPFMDLFIMYFHGTCVYNYLVFFFNRIHWLVLLLPPLCLLTLLRQLKSLALTRYVTVLPIY